MKLRKRFESAFKVLVSPKPEFSRIREKKFDPILGNYLALLLLSSAFAAVSVFVYRIAKGVYFHFFFRADINYSVLMNYAFGISVSVFFFFIFSFTVLLLLLSGILKLFFPKGSYTDLLKMMMYSATPLILFGWIPGAVFAMIIWSLFLFYTGAKSIR